MPSNRHLTVREISDFSPGLWENADWLMPPSGAQEMSDCYPQVGGGLRAFFKGTDLSASGITNASQERVIGAYARGGVPLRSGAAGTGVDRYLMTYRASAGAYRPRLYRMDGSAGDSTWTQVYVDAGTNEFNAATSDDNTPDKAAFRFFRLAAGSPNDAYVILSMKYRAATTRGPGIYRLNYNDATASQKAVELTTSVAGSARPCGPLTTHQARVMIGGGAQGETIIWSDEGTVTFGASNFLGVEPNQDLPGFVAMHALPPSDLFILKEGAAMVSVQGAITDPTVQQMAEGIAPGGSGKQDFGRTPSGLTFIATDGYVYEAAGSSVTNLSQQLGAFANQSDFAGPGDTNFINEFLFAPNGYVFHLPSKSWFKQTRLAGATHNVERSTRTIWGPVGTGASFALRSISPFPGQQRLNTYSWKSAPLRSADGRQLEVREVQVVAKSYDTNATIAITVGGTTVTKTLTTAGRQEVSAYFTARGEVLDIRVVPTAASSAVEAPSIEAVRFYSRSGHQVA